MKKATLALIIRMTGGILEILLGLKRGGPEIGEGMYNGPGGKLNEGETLPDCLAREVEEEVGIRLDASKAVKVAIITFHREEKDFEVHIYRVDVSEGEPRETDSMIPRWFPVDKIPWDRMHASDRAWMPGLLAGKKFNAHVYYRIELYHKDGKEIKKERFDRIEIFLFEDHE
ncbi:MAG: NUDIX domain-containing protein [Minisyncoccia bacterium]